MDKSAAWGSAHGANHQQEEKNAHSPERVFADNTSFHGLNRIGDPDKPAWLRILWVLAFGACFGVSVWQIYLRVDDYLQFGVNTKIAVKYESELIFPAVTICNFNRFRESEITANDLNFLQFILYAEDYDYDSYKDESWSWFGSSFDYYDYFANESTTFNYTEFTLRAGFVLDNATLLQCTWRGRNCYATNFTHVFTSYGNCWTFNSGVDDSGNNATLLSEDQPGAGNGLQVLIDIQQEEYTETSSGNPEAGLKILVHDQSDPPLMDSLGSAIPPGYHAFVGVKKNEYMNLQPPWGECDQSISLSYYENYTLSGCFIECRLEHIINNCSCKPVRYPGPARVCSPYESSTCVKEVLRDFKSGVYGPCACPVPCHYEQFETSISYGAYPSWSAAVDTVVKYGIDAEYQEENFVLLDVYFEELNYQLVQENKAQTPSGLISDVGGQLGLFVGASILTLGEIIEYIILRLRGLCKSERKERPASSKNTVDDSMQLGPRLYVNSGATITNQWQ